MTSSMSTETLMLQVAMGMNMNANANANSTDTNADGTSHSSTSGTTAVPSSEASTEIGHPSQRQQPKQLQRPIPLTLLTAASKNITCQRKRFRPVSDVVLDASLAYAYAYDDADTENVHSTGNNNADSTGNNTDTSQQGQGQGRRKIPRIVHTTSKSRCMPPPFRDNLRLWQNLTEHSFFFHDDDAVDMLLNQDWPEFPQLLKALQCSISGAAKADLWRALVLWEYGGIYTDMDNAPTGFNANTISPDDDAFFVVETMGIPSQFFFAASPRHPLTYLLIQAILHRLYDLSDTYNQYVPFVTGPGALKMAFQHFMKAHPPQIPAGTVRKDSQKSSLNRIPAGIYVGLGNRSVTVVGSKRRPEEYIQRNAIKNKKILYTQMGMRHFSKVHRQATNESCWRRLYETEHAALVETASDMSRPLW
jgi:mannosyltransferase OCH1-like enzyme